MASGAVSNHRAPRQTHIKENETAAKISGAKNMRRQRRNQSKAPLNKEIWLMAKRRGAKSEKSSENEAIKRRIWRSEKPRENGEERHIKSKIFTRGIGEIVTSSQTMKDSVARRGISRALACSQKKMHREAQAKTGASALNKHTCISALARHRGENQNKRRYRETIRGENSSSDGASTGGMGGDEICISQAISRTDNRETLKNPQPRHSSSA
jgi:hypothetical protein